MKNQIIKRQFKESKLLVFTDSLKMKFLEAYLIKPNISKVAKALGLNRRTVTRHLAQDEEFKLAVHSIRQEQLDDIEEYMMEHAKTRGGFMDRIAILKSERAKFQDKVKHDHHHDHEVIDNLYTKIPNSKVVNTNTV